MIVLQSSMNNFLLFFLLLLVASVSGQMGPCFIEEELREKETYYMVDELPEQFDLGVEGDNNQWLFAELMSPRSYKYIYTSADNGKYFDHFPNSSMVLREPWGKEIYYGTRDDKWYILGEASLKLESFVPSIATYRVPLSACAPTRFGSPRLSQVNYLLDSTEVNYNIEDIKDASGALYLSDGIYDAHRVKRTISSDDTNSDEIIYYFVDMHTGDFLLEASIGDNGLIDKVIYKTNSPIIDKDISLERNSFLLYPNRSYGQIRMEFKNFTAGTYHLMVTDIIGKNIWQGSYKVSGAETIKEDLSFLPRGVYTYAIVDSEQNTILTRRLAIIKS